MLRILKRLLLVAILLAAVGAIAVGLALYPKYREDQKIADSFDLGELDRIPAISEVFDCAGQRYSRLAGETRYVVPLSKISPYFVKALIAREDSRFYEHHGVDFSGIARAAVRNLKAGNVKEGASTLTQQLARNTYDLGEDKWKKKVVEALLALRIEKSLSKEEILEAYANRIYYGAGLYGVETASRACFGKPASELSLSQAAILAGLIRSPNRLTPLEDSRTALKQRDQVLARMEELKLITPAEAKAAYDEPMMAGKQLMPQVEENYAMDAIMRDLSILLPRDIVDRGGLKIYTTIDRRLQLIAEDSVAQKLTQIEGAKGWPHPTLAETMEKPETPGKEAPTESPYIEGALVAIDNESGGIRAVVGGRDFKTSPYNRAVLSKRQIGSTFKPFVYAAAFDHGMAPGTLVDDSPIQEGDIAGLTTSWSPENSDRDNEGMLPAAVGLIRSRNTMTVRVGEIATRAVVRQLARQAGFETVPDMPAIYLGAFETTLKNLTAAYTMFPNDGVRRQPYIIDHIEDRRGKTIYKATRAELRCISPATNFVMNELLRDVIRKGTATAAASYGLKVPAAGKTGTTNDYKDAWFVGYTTSLTCGVWVGMDHPQRIADKGYGSALALPIWVDFIENASSWKYAAEKFKMPSNLKITELCRVSGSVATDECRAAGTVYQAQLPDVMIPHVYCADHGGMMAGLPTDGSRPANAIAAAAPIGRPALSGVPVAEAEAVPVAERAPLEDRLAVPNPALPGSTVTNGENYRITRKPNGFIFENSR
ncbi:PBP1A family penicillin-binding protein [soil metagenome]